MTEHLTADDFQRCLRQTFTVMLVDDEAYALELTSVQYVGEPWQPGARRPFSLWFTHPRRDAYLPQRVYRLEHPDLGTLEIFLVPLGPDAGGMRYEAVFS